MLVSGSSSSLVWLAGRWHPLLILDPFALLAFYLRSTMRSWPFSSSEVASSSHSTTVYWWVWCVLATRPNI
jgi:hypothetical protein